MTSVFDGMAAVFVATLADHEPATWRRDGHPDTAVRVIPVVNPDGGFAPSFDGVGAASASTEVHLADADAPEIAEDDELDFRGQTWRVRSRHPDGRGMIRLELHQV